jgi:hypothetical protein
MRALEITDLLWRADAEGNRLPVVRAEAVDRLARLGQRRAARIVARMPATDGVLDDAIAAAFCVIAVAAVLAVEPTAGRRWYRN